MRAWSSLHENTKHTLLPNKPLSRDGVNTAADQRTQYERCNNITRIVDSKYKPRQCCAYGNRDENDICQYIYPLMDYTRSHLLLVQMYSKKNQNYQAYCSSCVPTWKTGVFYQRTQCSPRTISINQYLGGQHNCQRYENHNHSANCLSPVAVSPLDDAKREQ